MCPHGSSTRTRTAKCSDVTFVCTTRAIRISERARASEHYSRSRCVPPEANLLASAIAVGSPSTERNLDRYLDAVPLTGVDLGITARAEQLVVVDDGWNLGRRRSAASTQRREAFVVLHGGGSSSRIRGRKRLGAAGLQANSPWGVTRQRQRVLSLAHEQSGLLVEC